MKHAGIYQRNGNGWAWTNNGFIWVTEKGKYIAECFNYEFMTKEEIIKEFTRQNFTFRFNN